MVGKYRTFRIDESAGKGSQSDIEYPVGEKTQREYRIIRLAGTTGESAAINFIFEVQKIYKCSTLFSALELITDHLIESDKFHAAYHIINLVAPKILGKQLNSYKEQILRIEYICNNPSSKEMHMKPVSLERRENLLKTILKEIHCDPPPNRLLILLADALMYQVERGGIGDGLSYDLLEGKSLSHASEPDCLISRIDKRVQYSPESAINSIEFSSSGQFLGLGSFDGLIEIYEPNSYELHPQLKWQSEGLMLFHENPIQKLAFNNSEELLASLDSVGRVNIWALYTGKLLRKIEYEENFSLISWGYEPSHLLLGHKTIRLHGIRTMAVLKAYNASQENDILLGFHLIYTPDPQIISYSTNGIIRKFCYSSQEQVAIYHHTSRSQRVDCAQDQLHWVCPLDDGQTMLYTESYVLTLGPSLELIHKLELPAGLSIPKAITSPHSRFSYELHLITDSTQQTNSSTAIKSYLLATRELETFKIVARIHIDAEFNLLALHAKKNLLLSYDLNHSLLYWRPS